MTLMTLLLKPFQIEMPQCAFLLLAEFSTKSQCGQNYCCEVKPILSWFATFNHAKKRFSVEVDNSEKHALPECFLI